MKVLRISRFQHSTIVDGPQPHRPRRPNGAPVPVHCLRPARTPWCRRVQRASQLQAQQASMKDDQFALSSKRKQQQHTAPTRWASGVAMDFALKNLYVDLKCRVVSRHLPTIRVSRENICISQRPRQTATHQLTVGLAHIVLRADGPASTHLCTFLHNNWESFAQICMRKSPRKSRRVCYILHFWGTFLQSRVATLAYECCAETDWRVSGCGVA